MKRFRQVVLRYGTFVALLLMCGVLSILTLKEQPQTDPAAGRKLARKLAAEYPAGSRVLVAVRDNAEDILFADALAQQLTSGGLLVTRVDGTPQDARRKMKQLSDEGAELTAIAGNYISAGWLVFADLGNDFPSFENTQVHFPEPYRWPTFLKTENLLNVANQIAVIAIIAVGMTFVIITGGIDLSVGSLIALSSVVAARYIRDVGGGSDADFVQMLIGSLIGIAACGAVGFFSGGMVIGMDIPPFIVTLAMMMVASGAAFLLSAGNSIPDLPASYTWIGRDADLAGLPNAVVLMIFTYALAHLMLSKSVLGRHIYAVGDNRQAAWLSGIPVKKVLLFTYVASGTLAGIGGIVVASNYQSGDPRYGVMYELYVIAAVVVGGTSLMGGRGTVIGTLIGAFIIGVINNGMNLMQINPYAQKVILGLVILGAVMLDKLKVES